MILYEVFLYAFPPRGRAGGEKITPTPRFCGKHCPPGMVDILDRHCKQPSCDRQPIYGNSNEKTGRPLWCPDHRPSNSCDVKTSRCQESDCLKHPRYVRN